MCVFILYYARTNAFVCVSSPRAIWTQNTRLQLTYFKSLIFIGIRSQIMVGMLYTAGLSRIFITLGVACQGVLLFSCVVPLLYVNQNGAICCNDKFS